MATDEDYSTLEDRPYNTYLERSEDIPNSDYLDSNGNVETMPVKSDGSMNDLWITSYIRSNNWVPKTVGFYIDGTTGYAEFSNVYVSGNIQALTGSVGGFVIGADYIRDIGNMFGMASTTTGLNDVRFWAGASYANRATAPFRVYEDGSLAGTGLTITRIDLPDLVTASSFHVDTAGNTWWGSTTLATAVGKVLATGAATFSSINITGGNIAGTTTLGAGTTTASTIGAAITAAGNFADTSLNTATSQILSSFTFGASGAISIQTDINNGMWLSPNGLVAKNGGNITFSINGTTGVATMNGLVVGSNVGQGTAVTSGGVTSIVNGIVTTSYVNALYVTAGSVSANNITAGTITGSLLRTASSGMRVEIGSVITGTIVFYDASGNAEGGIFGTNSPATLSLSGTTGVGINIGSTGYGTLVGLWSSSGLIMQTGMTISNSNGKLFIPVGYNMY